MIKKSFVVTAVKIVAEIYNVLQTVVHGEDDEKRVGIKGRRDL